MTILVKQKFVWKTAQPLTLILIGLSKILNFLSLTFVIFVLITIVFSRYLWTINLSHTVLKKVGFLYLTFLLTPLSNRSLQGVNCRGQLPAGWLWPVPVWPDRRDRSAKQTERQTDRSINKTLKTSSKLDKALKCKYKNRHRYKLLNT